MLINELKDNFTQIPNEIITDINISAGALRVYIYIASKPTKWNVFNKDIQNQLSISRSETLSKYFKELIEGGYITREKVTATNKYSKDYKVGSFVYTLLINKNPLLLKNRNNGKTVITENTELRENRKHSNKELNSNKDNNITEDKPKAPKKSDTKTQAYKNFINDIKTQVPIKDKVKFFINKDPEYTIQKCITRLSGVLKVVSKQDFINDYIQHQRETANFSKNIHIYIESYLSFYKNSNSCNSNSNFASISERY